MSGATPAEPEVLVLGLGNILLRDEGIGVRALERLLAEYRLPSRVRAVDGGTMGLDLLPYLHGPTLAVVLAGVAGLMVYISLDELLPAAHLSQTRAGGLESRGGGRVDPVGQELASCHPSPLEAHHPVDRTSEQAHLAIIGTTAGMAVMALSLWLLG